MKNPLHICLHLTRHYNTTAAELQAIMGLKTRTFYNLMSGKTTKLPLLAYQNLLDWVEELAERPTSPDISLFIPEEIVMPYVVDRQTPFGKTEWMASSSPPVFSPVERRWGGLSINAVNLTGLLYLPEDEKPLNMRLYVKERGLWKRL